MIDGILTADLAELSAVGDRLPTERFLLEGEPWPTMMRLPVKRCAQRYPQWGYVQRERDGSIEPVVYCTSHPENGRSRPFRYASLEVLIRAGWRVES